MKTLFMGHVENMRNTVFREATREVESAIRRTMDKVELEFDNEVEGIVIMVSKAYRALLTNQNVFKAVSTARDEVRSLLSQVDGKFELVLRPPTEPANPEAEVTAMDIDHSVPAATIAGDSNDMADDNAVRTNTEPSVEVDAPMENA